MFIKYSGIDAMLCVDAMFGCLCNFQVLMHFLGVDSLFRDGHVLIHCLGVDAMYGC